MKRTTAQHSARRGRERLGLETFLQSGAEDGDIVVVEKRRENALEVSEGILTKKMTGDRGTFVSRIFVNQEQVRFGQLASMRVVKKAQS